MSRLRREIEVLTLSHSQITLAAPAALVQLLGGQMGARKEPLVVCQRSPGDVSRSTKHMIVTWLILPVVIRSSQRLSHARLSKSNFTVKLRMAHYISYSLLDSTLLLGYP